MKYRNDLLNAEFYDEENLISEETESLLPEELDRKFKVSDGPASTNYIVQQIFDKVVGVEFAKYTVTISFEARQVLTGNIVGKELIGLKITSKKEKSNRKVVEAEPCSED